jgi:hypothetical protein
VLAQYRSVQTLRSVVGDDPLSVEHLRAAKLLLILAFGMSACSYSPPNASDLNRPGYQADLAACHEAADTEAHHQVIAYGEYWFTYPVSLFVLKHREMNKCMQGKGYIP